MRLCSFDDFRLGVVNGTNVVDVTSDVFDIPHTGPHNVMSGLMSASTATARSWSGSR